MIKSYSAKKQLLKKKKQSLLWQIQGEKLPAPSYVLGTMHIKPKGDANWMQPYIEKMMLCEGFATEFDLADANPALIQQYALLPDNQSLSDFIPPKKLLKLERMLTKVAGIPFQAVLKMKPLFITNLLSEKILAEYQSVSMDKELYDLAQQMGKDISGIESFEEQLAILNKIPLEHQIKSLLKLGKNISNFRKQLIKLTAIYEEGDVQKIHKVSKKGIGKLKKLMLYDRNEIMADRIFGKIQEKSIFCAIGAGHLGGKQGVLRLLKLKGLKVKPV